MVDEMRSRLLVLLAALALALTAGFAVGCGGDDDDDDGGGGGGGGEDLGLIQDGQLLVGTDTPFPPFEIGQPPDITGYDIEVMNGIADNLGLEVTYQDTGFDTIFRDVANGQFDTAAAASTITPERQQKVNFTDPYYEAQQALLVPTDSDIASVADLGDAIVGAQDGTTGETYANDETDAAEVRGFPEGPDAVAALTTGQVDAVIIDQPVAVDAVEKQGGVEIVEEIATNELYGFAVALDNTALLDAMNGALQDLKDDGTIEDLYQQYFKTSVPDSVLSGTTEAGGGTDTGGTATE
jgi:polar amino acid transport system substrate-binding protein